jgi:2-polyprenyl-3-methyl-5-hydroxy-6-metoxy-1,4-benzoquinol methylase
MASLHPGVKCPLCMGSEILTKYSPRNSFQNQQADSYRCTTLDRSKPQILRCKDCGHVFSNPIFWPEDLEFLYSQTSDSDYLSNSRIKVRTFEKAAKLVRSHAPSESSLLEIGSYVGIFLKIMSDSGFKCLGIEPSQWGYSHSVLQKLDVVNGSLESTRHLLQDRKFDVVVSWDVIEHVRDPKEFFNGAASFVSENGILVISTLSRKNWFARITGNRWPWIIPMHLHYFDRQTILKFGANCNLKLIQEGAHIHFASLSYVLQRLIPGLFAKIPKKIESLLQQIVFPVGLGDVRYFIFRKL